MRYEDKGTHCIYTNYQVKETKLKNLHIAFLKVHGILEKEILWSQYKD